MIYVPIPVAMLVLGKPLPVDVLAPDGRLLLRKGQAILSQQQTEMLSAHQACMTESDATAWQKSYERMIRTLLNDGVSVDRILQVGMPSEIREADYVVGAQVLGGWLDLQEILRGLLYQGAAAISPLQRLDGIENRAFELLREDADESLFILFQALADTTLGYCATHALLSAVTVALTAEKLGLANSARDVLFRAALVMNIGIARDQDSLAQQKSPLSAVQIKLIRERPQRSLEILQQIGVLDDDQLDLVRWQHEADEDSGPTKNLESRRLLRLANRFVARMAPRKTRLAMSALSAARSGLVDVDVATAKLGSAMATTLGFYPPGTYALLINGEQAVSVARGTRANSPIVLSIVSPGGMPLSKYLYHDTSDPQFAIRATVNADKIKVKISLEKVRKAMKEHLP
jgi:hypothetical protein